MLLLQHSSAEQDERRAGAAARTEAGEVTTTRSFGRSRAALRLYDRSSHDCHLHPLQTRCYTSSENRHRHADSLCFNRLFLGTYYPVLPEALSHLLDAYSHDNGFTRPWPHRYNGLAQR